MILHAAREPLRVGEVQLPEPGATDVLLRVRACAVCRTDLHVVDGELPLPKLPLIPGHQIVGAVEAFGPEVTGLRAGDRMGVPWLGWACGGCEWCLSGFENLCPAARFTGYHADGGYAEHVIVDARFCLTLPAQRSDVEVAPLLCAGLIGFRAYRVSGDGQRLGLFGFGAAAHIIAQIAVADGREVYAFTRPGDRDGQR